MLSVLLDYVRNHLFIIEVNCEVVRSIIELHEEEIMLISIYESVRIRLSHPNRREKNVSFRQRYHPEQA